MLGAIHIARASLAAGALLILGQIPTPAMAKNLCWRGWHAQAEKTATIGLQLQQSGRSADRERGYSAP